MATEGQFDLFAPSAVNREPPAASATASDIVPRDGLDQLADLYSSLTEADFAHMERKLAELPADQSLSRGAALAELFLAVRSMERAEQFVGPLEPDAAPVHWIVISPARARTACGIVAASYSLATRLAVPVEGGDGIACTHDFFDGTVTCRRCREVAS